MRNLPDRLASIAYYREVMARVGGTPAQQEAERELARTDLFYLLVVVLGRKDVNRDWLFDRCREVEAAPNGFLDLWGREHYKSTIITFAKTIQDVLCDPEITVGIFSFNRPTAKAFLRQIKREFEINDKLRGLFPDIFWENPHKDAPKWSEDDGIIVKRGGNPKESTIEAWGLVDAQPTGRHFKLMIYDDVVTKDSVTNSDMIKKVTESWEASLNLASEGGAMRHIGTRWHHADTYREILARRAVKARIYPSTDNGKEDGNPVLLSRESLAEKRRNMGPYTFGAQHLMDPTADRSQGFEDEWIRYYEGGGDFRQMTKYLLVDAANEKKTTSDYTVMAVIGLGEDRNYYLLDMIRDRINLTERCDALFAMYRRWRPNRVGYERYGIMADVQHIKYRQNEENFRFEIIELGGKMPKPDRIKRLVAPFENGRFHLPETLFKVDYEGHHIDLVRAFIDDEYKPFPVAFHDDMLDCISRIEDPEMQVVWPKGKIEEDRYTRPRSRRRVGSWMAA